MTDVKIIINGKEFPLYYQMLYEMAIRFPKEVRYVALEKALIDLNIPSITEKLIERNDELPAEMMDEVWKNGDMYIRRTLLNSEQFIINLSDEQVQDIIDADDKEMLKLIVKNNKYFFRDKGKKCTRLSVNLENELIQYMYRNLDDETLKDIWDNSNTPPKYLPKFQEYYFEKNHKDFAINIISGIKKDDVPTLAHFPPLFLIKIAEHIDKIRSKNAQEKTAEFLATHADPGIRMALARNDSAPNSALLLLKKDKDRDIARAANESDR